MIYPKFIKKGDCIGVPAPSDGASEEVDRLRDENSKKKLEEFGFKVKFSKHIFNSEEGRSSSQEERGRELNEMIEDQNINMLICATGGEFLVEMLSFVDFEKIVQNPKFIQGFSDPTGILFPLTVKYDIATIYGGNFSRFGMDTYHECVSNNLEILKGNIVTQKSFDLYENERVERTTGLEGYNLTEKVEWKILNNLNAVKIKGRVFAGCLDLIDILSGTKYDGTKEFIEKYKNDGIVWCFDVCDFTKEQLIRSLWRLDELGYFKYTSGVIFGRSANDSSCFDYDMKTALERSVLSKYKFPVVFDADISHKSPSLTIINGAISEFDVKNGKATINFELV